MRELSPLRGELLELLAELRERNESEKRSRNLSLAITHLETCLLWLAEEDEGYLVR